MYLDFELSNFYRQPFELDGCQWPTVEHYFQAAKFTDEQQQARIRNAASPRQAKQLGHGLSPLRSDWERVRESVMLRALDAKFRLPVMRELLLGTGNALLQEASPTDSYWGIGADGKGRNRLGCLLMQLRETLRQEQT